MTWLVALVLTTTGVHYLLASAAGALTGAITDFSMKRYWAFQRVGKASLALESWRYVVVSACSLLWNLVVAFLLVEGLGVNPLRSVLVASIVVGLAWNYPMHRWVVFRSIIHDEDEQEDEDADPVQLGE